MQVFQQNAVATTTDDDEFANMSAGSLLPRLELLTANSEDVKSGEATANTYRLVAGESLTSLGKEVEVIPVAMRFTAIHNSDDGLVAVHTHTPSKDEIFQSIMNTSDTQGFGSGAMYGPEFLLWLPSQSKFVSFFCNNKTARRAAGGLKDLIGQPATMGNKKFENKKFTWFGFKVTASNVPVTNVPEADEMQAIVSKFMSDTGTDQEAADEPDRER